MPAARVTAAGRDGSGEQGSAELIFCWIKFFNSFFFQLKKWGKNLFCLALAHPKPMSHVQPLCSGNNFHRPKVISTGDLWLKGKNSPFGQDPVLLPRCPQSWGVPSPLSSFADSAFI